MSKRIVVVDDEVEIAQLLKIKLEREGYAVSLAHDGEAGLGLIIKVMPHLILLDVVMPQKNGYEVLQELKQSSVTKDIPVIMLTGKVYDQDIQKGLDLEADDYIAKPFHSELILKRIDTVLQRR